MRTLVTALGLASLLACVARPAAALSMEDCQQWLDQLEGEVSGVNVSGAQGSEDRTELLKSLDSASLRRDGAKASQSLKNVAAFKKRAAQLAAKGQIGPIEGERLDNLSETVQHCIEQVQIKE